MNEAVLTREWIRVGLGAGLAASAVYPALLFLSGPPELVLVLAVAFGPLLAVGTVGLYHLVALHRRSVALQLGVGSSVVGGVLFLCMVLVQLAVRQTAQPAAFATSPDAAVLVRRALDGVQLGLDVAWDVGLGVGVLAFAWALRRHPRFGWGFTVPGLAVGAALLVLDLATFPRPPAAAGLVDVGPLVGLWFLAVMVQALRSLAWADRQLGWTPAEDGAGEG